MKKTVLLIALAAVAAGITGCGSTDYNALSEQSAAGYQETADAADVNNIPESESSAAESDPEPQGNISAAPESAVSGDGETDIDLTQLNSSMVYAQVSDMINNSDNYLGKTVKAKGTFSYFQDSDGREFFAVLISDATACCAQGIEFVLDGDYSYPDDYPADGTEITVVGKFNYYEENGYTYVQLTDAAMTADESSS